jgi:hypothetical protein
VTKARKRRESIVAIVLVVAAMFGLWRRPGKESP